MVASPGTPEHQRAFYEALFADHGEAASRWFFGDVIDRGSVRDMLTGRAGRLLDLGCGVGAVLKELPRRERVGIDLAHPSPLSARRRLPGVRLVQGDIARLPFRDGSFDAVVILEVLEHLPDDVPAFREAARVLRDGGEFIVHVPGRPDGVATERDLRDQDHHRFYNRELLLAHMDGCYRVEDLYYLGTFVNPFWRATRRAFSLAGALANLATPRAWPYFWRRYVRRRPPEECRELALGKVPVWGRWWYRRLVLPLLVAWMVPLDRWCGRGETWWWRSFGGSVNARLRRVARG